MSQVGPSAQYHAKTAPINGAFPLDHDGECKEIVGRYLACLKMHGQLLAPCRALARDYFACRMEHGLMSRDDLQTLGFSDIA